MIFISLSMIISESIYVIIKATFLSLKAKIHTHKHKYIPYFFYPFITDGHDCFHILAIVYDTAVNMGGAYIFKMMFSFSLPSSFS